MIVKSDGKIIVVGGSGGNFAMARYNANGSLDMGFDSDGKLTTDFGGTDIGFDVALQADGKIVVVGEKSNDFAVARYDGTNGALDTTFDTDGKLTTDIGSSTSDTAYSVIVQPRTKKGSR